jgi:rare lipoprotein A
MLTSGCVRHKRIQAARPPSIGASEEGIASWYGVPYHGRRAANGEIYDMEKLTAAHRTLPFDTWVRVKNLTNDKVIDVRIQDRGPFIDGRIIDLSRAAARAIDLIGPGTAKVRITVVKAPQYIDVPPPPPESKPPAVVANAPSQPKTSESARPPIGSIRVPTGPPAPGAPTSGAASTPSPSASTAPRVFEPELYAVQVGAFQDLSRAEAIRDSMREKYGAARLVLRQGNPSVWRVLVGEEESTEEAAGLAARIRTEIGGSAFVVRLDNPVPPPSTTQP